MANIGQNIDNINILALAFVGDSVYDLWVRSNLVKKESAKVNSLHKKAIHFVSAKGQAEFFDNIKEILTEDELAVFNRGKNSKAIPTKNANPKDYAIATGLEATLGWLYLKEDNKRLEEILNKLM